MKITLNKDATEIGPDVRLEDHLKERDKKLFKSAVALRINGKACDLTCPVKEGDDVEVITLDSPEGEEIIRHSTSHVMASAVKHLYENVQVTIGPSIENGFYYDFDREEKFTKEDLPKIEKEMRHIISQNLPFERSEMKVSDAIEFFKGRGESFKVELIEDLVKGHGTETVSIYKTGDFVDLCTGPHIPATSKIKAFKLLDLAGAYWRGDEHRKMLQRIYGMAFATQEELDEYVRRIEEAKKRDHRRLGKDLDLFSLHEDFGPGLVYWHPKGAMVRHIIESFWKEEHLERGYEFCYTPHVAKIDLWNTSGHTGFYKENMYSPMDVDGQEYLIKPMNCPFHILIYKTKLHSYRDLPLRWAELGTVYRYERSGVLHGLLRVRGFTQDDAHIFCTPEQLENEIIGCVDFSQHLLKVFGFEKYDVYLATRPEDFAGTSEDWDVAESTLELALNKMGIPHTKDEGGAVFYGPKIDIKIKDALGRDWQGPTIQFDFNLPSRFGVTYIGQDGKEHFVYMVHRAMLGSIERFMGCLIEHYAGAFPVWLAPVQVSILPITDRPLEYARELAKKLKGLKIRAEVDERREKVNLKIRDAQKMKVPYMIIVGDEEMTAGNISLRSRGEGDLGKMELDAFIERITSEIVNKVC